MKYPVLIQMALNGKVIQCSKNGGPWIDLGKREAIANMAAEYPSLSFRIKPEPKPDVVKYGGIYQQEGGSKYTTFRGAWEATKYVLPSETVADEEWPLKAKFKVVFDGETGEVKSMEIVK